MNDEHKWERAYRRLKADHGVLRLEFKRLRDRELRGIEAQPWSPEGMPWFEITRDGERIGGIEARTEAQHNERMQAVLAVVATQSSVLD